jgi:hypothetical protein
MRARPRSTGHVSCLRGARKRAKTIRGDAQRHLELARRFAWPIRFEQELTQQFAHR